MARIYKKKYIKKRAAKKRALRRRMIRRVPRSIVTNTAAVRENYSTSIPDGTMVFFSTALSFPTFDRAQTVASAFQEYRIKYVKIMFRPSADTFAPAAGNIIPNLYFQMNKYQSVPTNATLQTLLDMGCRPIRFDDKNIVKAWKPTVLLGTDTTTPVLQAQKVMTTPWLSTNADAQNPVPAWSPSDAEHLGAIFLVQKPNPATPTINYTIDVEVVFQFRRPLAQVLPSSEPNTNLRLQGEELRPVVTPSL